MTVAAADTAAMSNAVEENAPPSLEVETLRERLLTQVGGRSGGTRGLPRCATKFRDFLSTVLTSSDNDDSSSLAEIRSLKQDLEREIKLYQIEMRKVSLMAQAAQLEEEACDREQEELNQRVAECQRDIAQVQQRWTTEKKKRRNREEYEALAKLANKRSPRRELQKQLDAVQKEMDDVASQEDENQAELEAREKQFQLLLQCMFDLKSSLREPKEEEKEVQSGNDMEDEEEEGVVPMETGL